MADKGNRHAVNKAQKRQAKVGLRGQPPSTRNIGKVQASIPMAGRRAEKSQPPDHEAAPTRSRHPWAGRLEDLEDPSHDDAARDESRRVDQHQGKSLTVSTN